jgi:hypothetical protein
MGFPFRGSVPSEDENHKKDDEDDERNRPNADVHACLSFAELAGGFPCAHN